MIEITKAYKTEDGETFPTLEQAQNHELWALIEKREDGSVVGAIYALIANADKVIAILKLKARKPRTSRAKKAKPVVALAK